MIYNYDLWMREIRTMEKIDHIGIVVTNINHAVKWYTDKFDCKVNYQDSSWAELQFDNIKLGSLEQVLSSADILVLLTDHRAHRPGEALEVHDCQHGGMAANAGTSCDHRFLHLGLFL